MRTTCVTKKEIIILLVSFLSIISVFFMHKIPQTNSYHCFSDEREFFQISNFWNVISNVGFVFGGCIGIYRCFKINKNQFHLPDYLPLRVFFIGIVLTGIGSSYYHLNPNSNTLLWDRLPMTISFMAFFAIIIQEFISKSLAKKILFPLIIIGFLSLVYWKISACFNAEDLRAYALIQFLPMLLIPIILLLYPGKNKTYYWLIISVYVLAKLFEILDVSIFLKTNFISGHSLKHIVASIVPGLLIIIMKINSYKNATTVL